MLAASFHELPDVHVGRAVGVGSPVEEALGWWGDGGAEGGVHDDEAFEAPGFFQGEGQTQEAAPVLDNEGDVGEVEGCDEVEEGEAVVGEGVPGWGGGFVGAAEADEVGADDAAGGSGGRVGGVGEEGGDHVAVEVGPGGLAVEAEEYFWYGTQEAGALVDVGHPVGAIVEVLWGIGEVWEV